MWKVFVEPKEFARFIVAGTTAAFTNMAAVWAAGHALSFGAALAVGVVAGFLTSFLLTKTYAFKAASAARQRGEVGRFVIVYALGALVYWIISFASCKALVSAGLETPRAEFVGTFLGNVAMAVVTYVGHRLFTFRTFPSKI